MGPDVVKELLRETASFICAFLALAGLGPVLMVLGLAWVFNDPMALVMVPWWIWMLWIGLVAGWLLLRRRDDGAG